MTAMFDCIREDLDKLEELLLQSLKSPVPLMTDMTSHVVKSGGKRLRPALFLLSARAGRDFSLTKALPLGAALELIHTASLVHDDVIDEADLRRGVPTANAKWGKKMSILAGDYIFAAAFRLVAGGDYGNRVSLRLAELVENLSEGEILETQVAFSGAATEDEYNDRISKKTANFLEICCELGGIVGGLSDEDTAKLAAYGKNIGMAFQITDDLLDLVQTEEKIGKPAGNDIRQGIMTLPMIRALKISPDAEELAAILKNPAGRVERAIEIISAADGIDYSRQKADDYLKAAKNILPNNLPSAVAETFIAAADFIGEREF